MNYIIINNTDRRQEIEQIIKSGVLVFQSTIRDALAGKRIYLEQNRINRLIEAKIDFSVMEEIFIFSYQDRKQWTRSKDLALYWGDNDISEEFKRIDQEYHLPESDLVLPSKGEFLHFSCCCGHRTDIIFITCPSCGRRDHLESIHTNWSHNCCGEVVK